MCTHNRYVYNPYNHRHVLVSCGMCKECLMKKAMMRATRIKNSLASGMLNVFVTLTYDNEHIPVVCRDEVEQCSSVPVYRGHNPNAIDALYVGEYDAAELTSIYDTPSPRRFGDNRYFAIVYYRDIQNFFKRLRINIKRYANRDIPIKYYACSEYGETYFRPHFHAVLSIPAEDFETVRNLIVKSWPFSNKDRLLRGIELARNVSSYVATYVNGFVAVPPILRLNPFRQKFSYSVQYGVASRQFSAVEILKKITDGNLFFTQVVPSKDKTRLNTVLIPQYVVNRHFPLFKGYTRLAPSEVQYVLQGLVHGRFSVIQDEGYRLDDFKQIQTSLVNHARRFCNAVNMNVDRSVTPLFAISDYLRLYEQAWNLYRSSVYKQFLLKASEKVDHEHPWSQFYDNANEVRFRHVHCDSSIFPSEHIEACLNYNALPSRLESYRKFSECFDHKVKQRKVNQRIQQTFYQDL